jgi:hypothetical protein
MSRPRNRLKIASRHGIHEAVGPLAILALVACVAIPVVGIAYVFGG